MRDLALVIVIFGSLPVILMRPWIGVLAWAWLGFMNPHRLAWSFARSMPLAQIVSITVLLGLLMDKTRRSIPITRETVLIFILAAYFTFTTFFAWDPEAAWNQWDKVMKIFLMTMVTSMLIYSEKRVRWFVLIVILSIGFYGFKGGIFSIHSGGQHRVWGPAATFLAGNNALGLAMIMVIPLLFQVARGEANVWLKRFLYLVFALNIVATVFTYSRGAMLGLAVTFLYMLLRVNKRFGFLLLAAPIIYLIIQFAPQSLTERAETIETYKEDYSAMQRIQAWWVAFNIAKESPLTGAGFNFEAYPDDSRWLGYVNELGPWENESRAAHSIWFQVLGQHGFVALFLFIWLLYATWKRMRRIQRRAKAHPEADWIGRYANGMEVGLVGFMATGTFLSLAYFDLLYTYIILGVILERELDDLAEAGEAQTPGHGKQSGMQMARAR